MRRDDEMGEWEVVSSTRRRPYAAPRIEESGQFEHLVLACNFSPANPDCQGIVDPPAGGGMPEVRMPRSL